jgi:hypothetical protein
VSDSVFNGRITRLNLHRDPRPDRVSNHNPNHPAFVEGRTFYPSRVRDASDVSMLLKPGAYSAKLGRSVEKGAWVGMPIFSLTLEERATCPRSCALWLSCYGNGMPLAARHAPGRSLVVRLRSELGALQHLHPKGFVVRLHVLGDFYSKEYVSQWLGFLDKYPALRVFGYTAWPRTSPIGSAIADLTSQLWDRFAIRWSSHPGPQGTVVLTKWSRAIADKVRREQMERNTVICPAQTGSTRSCASCGLCWSPAARDKTIAFILHGMAGRRSA